MILNSNLSASELAAFVLLLCGSVLFAPTGIAGSHGSTWVFLMEFFLVETTRKNL